ncbi:MAG: S-methyl-5-thioribose-1-phosphate isomerase [Candidatus Eisenbacteria bacterium]|uniref:Methylthioribose-1-phosphate isomerase n=1 Tax=Eiseniibacteriota bacterium TaxID=2212470 RepID=A0A538UAG4_UNCEI|nr:MAG: S-methyl-5-thioribose-1-phosphate isomerase [Candidatus Eisenbacteria bacterium]
MKVGGQDTRAAWWSDEGVRYLDQRVLPGRVAIGLARTVEEVARAIETMAVRGAPLIGVVAAYGLALAARRGEAAEAAYARLARTRPTAVNLWKGLDAVQAAGPGAQARLAAARAFDDAEVAAAEAIGRHGLALFRRGTRVLTHCNAGWLAVQDWGTALAPVYQAARAGLEPFVWVSETRPRLQGARLTAWELGEEGVAHTLIADGAAAHLIQRGRVDLVLTGADRIAANGDAANKIGTYSRALAAQAHGVPFFIAAPRTTIDPATLTGADIVIEERDPDEVLTVEGLDEAGKPARVRVAPAGTPALNPAFDVTPGALIAGIITEIGIVPATAEGIAGAMSGAERTESATPRTASGSPS